MENSMNDSNVAKAKDTKAKNDDVKVDIIKEDVTHANDLLSSPNFLRIPLKPIEQQPPPSNDEPTNDKTWVLKSQSYLIRIACFFTCIQSPKWTSTESEASENT